MIPVKGAKLQETIVPFDYNVMAWIQIEGFSRTASVSAWWWSTYPSRDRERARHEAVHFSGGLNFYDSRARRWRMHRPKKSCLAMRPDVLALSFAWKIGAMYPKSRRDQRRARFVSPRPFGTSRSDNRTGFLRVHSFIEQPSNLLILFQCEFNLPTVRRKMKYVYMPYSFACVS